MGNSSWRQETVVLSSIWDYDVVTVLYVPRLELETFSVPDTSITASYAISVFSG